MKVKFTLKDKYAESVLKMKVGDYVVLDGMSSVNGIPQNGQLKAAIEGINIIKKMDYKNKVVVTDSEYVIKCATTYGDKLVINEWISKKTKLPPPNVELVKRLYELTKKYDIKYKHPFFKHLYDKKIA